MRWVYAVVAGAGIAHVAVTVYQNPSGAWVLGGVLIAAGVLLMVLRG